MTNLDTCQHYGSFPVLLTSSSRRRILINLYMYVNVTDPLHGARILNLSDQNVGPANVHDLVHDNSHLRALHHGAHSYPVGVFQASDGWCSLAGCDLDCFVECRSLDVVCAKNETLCS